MADYKHVPIVVFLDSGIQKKFIPLRRPSTYTELPKNCAIPSSLSEALEEISSYEEIIPEETKTVLDRIFLDSGKCAWMTCKSYLKYRFGKKIWHLKNGLEISLNGVWFMIETNTSTQEANKGVAKYDRGYFYQSNCFTEKEKESFVDLYKKRMSYPGGASLPYIDLKENDHLTIEFVHHDTALNSDEKIDLGGLSFEIAIRSPNGETRDVDVILDLGNTRTAGLLFDHIGQTTFEPENFKKLFKILRIKPDPSSGEFDSLDDVEAGIVPSWFVLHQLEHQKYLGKSDSKLPSLLVTEYKGLGVQVQKKGWGPFGSESIEIYGNVCQRIPQMFMQLSPVLLGDQAERVFNTTYARALVAHGANLQQSSPKRYYWDTDKKHVYWNMLLNEWDNSYDVNPQDATALPKLQGEILRFIQENGEILDFTKEREPVDAPTVYPEKPTYPNQSTLTWFLLHILERAYAQVNSAFAKGATFIPHRLNRVLMTYPSGWTEDEIKRYRERCQEALNIFSQTNIYHGVLNPKHVELITREDTPDEAVAGQLPFLFSEIIRYPGLTASEWIALVGKKRKGETSEAATVRIMNFDIGGGTTDISIVEYKDLNKENSGVSQNLLSACLLFKDGQAMAGDDLVKKIIEKIILGSLLNTKKNVPNLLSNIKKRFTQASTNVGDETIRGRIVRTCLIPLAIKCLGDLGKDSVQFSAKDAAVNKNNWKEFLDFIDVPEAAIPFNQACFSFGSNEINGFIEEQFKELFQNCAMYADAYDIDMLIFSGKPSELPYFRMMAKNYIPIDDGRIIFARDFKPGSWYPFTDDLGFIKDAKTVTVVGGALYYALHNGFISNWKIETAKNISVRNEWGELMAMKNARKVFLSQKDEEASISILPNTIIARRQNICSSPEPVYKFIPKGNNILNDIVKVTLKRNITEDGEFLTILAINDDIGKANDFELKLWPCENSSGFEFWQEKGIFENLEGESY